MITYPRGSVLFPPPTPVMGIRPPMVVEILDRARSQASSFHELRGDAVHAGPWINEDHSFPVVDDCGSDVSQIEPTHSCILIPICGGSGSGTSQF